MNTPAIEAAMRERYKAPEYALMFEVGNATGFSTRRHADAVAMSLWPSRRALYSLTERVAREAEQLSKAIAELDAALKEPEKLAA